ncbi:hypothetical protein WJX75_001627 [Coccomyxa subellipsoidea]|uniref:DUF6851 domain-containing protein n=1 Tax=Coccomyxa subellipsoidea TaxID=248742 RepID=A0ABR2Z2H1_9CHLO
MVLANFRSHFPSCQTPLKAHALGRNESKWQSQSTVTINEAANAAISGAATKALTNLFPAANQTKQIMSFLQATKDSKGAAFNLGEKACGACILARAEDGSNQYGKDYNSISSSPYADTTNYFPVNPPQMVPGITECGKLRSHNHWQPILQKTGK